MHLDAGMKDPFTKIQYDTMLKWNNSKIINKKFKFNVIPVSAQKIEDILLIRLCLRLKKVQGHRHRWTLVIRATLFTGSFPLVTPCFPSISIAYIYSKAPPMNINFQQHFKWGLNTKKIAFFLSLTRFENSLRGFSRLAKILKSCDFKKVFFQFFLRKDHKRFWNPFG